MTVLANPSFLSLVRHPFKFRLYTLMKLPSAFFSGVRVRSLTEEACAVSVPFKWFSQNPFRSTYFACLAMAAEMSTGVLALLYMPAKQTAVSMLVVKLEASYFKKATSRTTFTCSQGVDFQQAIQKALETGEAQQVTATSEGINEAGELIARFDVTWSFKTKSRIG